VKNEPAADSAAPASTTASLDDGSPSPLEPRWWTLAYWRGTTPNHKVGALHYTRAGLFIMFFWLLWGDLVFSLSETIFPASMPLQLERLGIPKEWISWLMGTVGATVNVALVPIISFRSDRTRTRFGRRIPYILFTIPAVVLLLASLGFTDDIGNYLRASTWPARLGISPTMAIVGVVGAAIILFDIANVFVNSVFWYLFRDVVPTNYMGRFQGAFRTVGILCGLFWQKAVVPHLETHTHQLYLGFAALYLFGFTLMCLMVREGQYPPPDDVPAKGESWYARLSKAVATYVRECFSHPLYVAFYVGNAVLAISYATGVYRQFFFLRYQGFTLKQMGDWGFIAGMIALIVQFPMGMIVDRFHPMRCMLIAALWTPFIMGAYFFLGEHTIFGFTISAFGYYIAMSLLNQPSMYLSEAASYPLVMRLFPEKQFGQFCSANAMVRHFSMISGTFLGGLFMGMVNRRFGSFGNAYSFLWQGWLHIVALTFMIVVYFYWRQLGGLNFRLRSEAAGIEVADNENIASTEPARDVTWRPLKVGAIIAVILTIIGSVGLVAVIHRPDMAFEVDRDKTMVNAPSLEAFTTAKSEVRAAMESQHHANLSKLSLHHWFWQRDTLTEQTNYDKALGQLERTATNILAAPKWEATIKPPQPGDKGDKPVTSLAVHAPSPWWTPYAWVGGSLLAILFIWLTWRRFRDAKEMMP